jgi:hypothetical protein
VPQALRGKAAIASSRNAASQYIQTKKTYFRETNFRNNLDSSHVTGRKPWAFMIDSDSAVDKKP